MVLLASPSKYNWVDSKIVGTYFVLSDQEIVSATNITFARPSDWLFLLVDPEKMIYNTFGHFVPFYEFRLPRISL